MLANWLNMAELGRMDIDPGGWQRHLRNQPRGIGEHIPGEGSWLVSRVANMLVSVVDFDIHEDFVDHILLDDCVMFQFALDGSMRMEVPSGASVQHDGFRCTMLTFNNGRLVRRLSGRSDRIRYVGVIVPKQTLMTDYGVAAETLRDSFSRFSLQGSRVAKIVDYPLHQEQLRAIHAVLDCPFTGTLRQRYIEAKVCELLCLTIADIGTPQLRSTRVERDQLSIEAAAEILSSSTDDTLSLERLARRVGLNRNKITEGFRQTYGMTPFEYAREAKLIRARRLIVDTHQSMFDIATAIGFTSQSSFSRAYKSRFGMSPRKERNTETPPIERLLPI